VLDFMQCGRMTTARVVSLRFCAAANAGCICGVRKTYGAMSAEPAPARV
jgi:hypothetical protein